MGDACSLVDAFRAGEVSPLEALDGSLAAIEASNLNAFSYLDVDGARAAARDADVSLPFGGVPVGIKELDRVEGWPYTEASIPLAHEVADTDATQTARVRAAGGVLVGLTTASEFGGVNLTRTKLNGTTHNPWNAEHTPGGSSGGSAAAVAGGLVPIATAGDGGGSIRIPAGFTGLFGLKNTFGRIPKGPHMEVQPLTAVIGCVSRSVRDTARWLDVCNGFDPRDPYSLPRVDGWEASLGTHELAGKRVAIVPCLNGAVVHPEVQEIVADAAASLAKEAGLKVVEVDLSVIPHGGVEWAMAGLVAVLVSLGDRWPACKDDLTPEIKMGIELATNGLFSMEMMAQVERYRTAANEAMASVFEQTDFVIAATSPDIAFGCQGPLPSVVGDIDVVATLGFERGMGNNGALTIPANITGVPAVSIPAGHSRGLPVGLQVIAPHHREAWLLDLALLAERSRPWPLVAPGSPL